MTATHTLRSLNDIKSYFQTRDRKCYFISPTNFNMLGLHDWVKGWVNINMIDCFDGAHPQVFLHKDDYSKVFQSLEEVNEYLLSAPAVQHYLKANAPQGAEKDQAIFLFFNPELEAMCEALGLEVAMPKNSMVREIDSKIVTTEIGNQAGVGSVPNILTRISSFNDLSAQAAKAGLGEKWVIQTAYGDSGKTTFFIASEEDYAKHAEDIEREDKVKVMRWVRCSGTAIEAYATRWGTFVGPLLTELIGIDALTPYQGGWCGNELYQDAFTPALREQIQNKTRAMGDALYQRGYRGIFELDYLLDLDTGEVYLGELNSRISGISAMTNMSQFCQNNIPLFLFHLLEYDANVDLHIDIEAFHQQMLHHGAQGIASQVVLKYIDEPLQIITQTPVSGVYALLPDGQLQLQKTSYSRHDALEDNQAYVLRIMQTGEYAYKGCDLAIMFLNNCIRTSAGQLNPVGARWVQALKVQFNYRQLTHEERTLVEMSNNAVNVKSGSTD